MNSITEAHGFDWNKTIERFFLDVGFYAGGKGGKENRHDFASQMWPERVGFNTDAENGAFFKVRKT